VGWRGAVLADAQVRGARVHAALRVLCFHALPSSSLGSSSNPAAAKEAGAGAGAAVAGRGEKPGSGIAEVESGGDVGGELVHFDGPLAFTADDLLCATAEIMGKSTYGTVYKAAAARPLRHRLLLGRPRGCGWPAWPRARVPARP